MELYTFRKKELLKALEKKENNSLSITVASNNIFIYYNLEKELTYNFNISNLKETVYFFSIVEMDVVEDLEELEGYTIITIKDGIIYDFSFLPLDNSMEDFKASLTKYNLSNDTYTQNNLIYSELDSNTKEIYDNFKFDFFKKHNFLLKSALLGL